MGGNQALFGPLAKKWLSENKWADMYPGHQCFSDDLEHLIAMLERENQIGRYLSRLKAKSQLRDEALAELRVAFFLKSNGFAIIEWEPPGNGRTTGEFTVQKEGDLAFFVEVKSPGWEGQLSTERRKAGRAKLPKYLPSQTEGGAVGHWQDIRASVKRAYTKFSSGIPNLLAIVDDFQFPLQYAGDWFPNIALFDKTGTYGERGYFTSDQYQNLGAVAVLNWLEPPQYYVRIYENPHARRTCKLPQSILDLKGG